MKDAVVGSGDKTSGKATSMTATGRQTVSDLARKSGAGLAPSPGMMCQQGQDWSRGMACFPQKLVQLVGYRDPGHRPSPPISGDQTAAPKKRMSSDTPIG